MNELKTLKDLKFDKINVNQKYQTNIIREDELKAEAVKWIKSGDPLNELDWIRFFNLNEEDLKQQLNQPKTEDKDVLGVGSKL